MENHESSPSLSSSAANPFRRNSSLPSEDSIPSPPCSCSPSPPCSCSSSLPLIPGASEAREEGKPFEGLEPKRRKQKRAFNWDAVHTAHFLLKLAYDGSAYSGIAYQGENSAVRTVEGALFDALEKTCLIRDRNAWQPAKRLFPEENYDYAAVLNAVLPGDIRIVASAPVPPGFDARFDCTGRVYKYFFHSEGLDLPRMHRAAQRFVGEHNFRYFCKLDPRQYRNPRRTLTSFAIEPVGDSACAVATIAGRSFLWHQVRFMMAALLKVGRGTCDEAYIVGLLNRGEEEEREDQARGEDGMDLKERHETASISEGQTQKHEEPEPSNDIHVSPPPPSSSSSPAAASRVRSSPSAESPEGPAERDQAAGEGKKRKREKVRAKAFSAGLAPAAPGCLVLYDCLFEGVQWDREDERREQGGKCRNAETELEIQSNAETNTSAAKTNVGDKTPLNPRETFQNQHRKALERVQVLRCLGGMP
ncbi:hypothetical protein NCLIV_012350 [Neospora caninum Liverpool]|uniref:tRNA pseudouridine synthase n=1 Tax=Neospora caninum (strain Liverpool) TaxID=572307 RepID=F0VCS2_NEOCL|nr:hypothetical protein NCLIV_012350 [Neospora caninum Liverpool]CBZ51437.1 hypothetical protein NCLIV_012350 [Neospora caninum Liverpool]CEL65385.1 TPA: tRNA pseudouridine synthase 3 [Neospora caninum Liverpool]|eukprot:XP_003881470.1 hypothetical protein NCLIV_012350 [Neospora caninum Liverpool]